MVRDIFPDSVLAVALIDRLLHHAIAIDIRADDYRLRNHDPAGLANDKDTP
ncbi:MAG: ATP-binding protein [Acidimicrobiia bacterium]